MRPASMSHHMSRSASATAVCHRGSGNSQVLVGQFSGTRSDGELQVMSLALRHATPNPVRLVNLQSVVAAGQHRGALQADSLGIGLSTGSGRAALALRMKEVRTRHPAAGCAELPIPDIGVGTWQASGICHFEYPLGHPDESAPRPSSAVPPVRLRSDPRPRRRCSGDHVRFFAGHLSCGPVSTRIPTLETFTPGINTQDPL